MRSLLSRIISMSEIVEMGRRKVSILKIISHWVRAIVDLVHLL